MAKKEKKIQATPLVVPKQIDYIKIIDEMNDVSFAFCMQYLYPLFNYQVLDVDDVRRIDLKETLVRTQNHFLSNTKEKKQGFLNYYLSLIRAYFEAQFKCEENSRAEIIKNRALTAMDNVENSDDDYSLDIDDIVIIFVSFIREYLNKSGTAVPIGNVDIDIDISDADTLTMFYNRNIREMNGQVKLPIPIIKGLFETDNYALRVMYINSIIFLCMSLQSRGIF